MKKILAIPYSKEYKHIRLMDLFVPDKPNQAGILFVHGGGWRGGTREHWHPAMEYFCKLGYTCASASYRLVPDYIFPAAFEDIRLAMGWFKVHAPEYGIKNEEIAAWGSSAGAHLCALLATTQPEDKLGITSELKHLDTLPAAVVSYAGLYLLKREGMPPLLKEVVNEFLGGDEAQTIQRTNEASPYLRICGKEPPFAIFVGEYDDVIPLYMHQQMVAKLKEYAVEVEFYVVPGMKHGLGYAVQSEVEKKNALIVEKFLKKHLKLSVVE
mgnify:CR=1 FL=1